MGPRKFQGNLGWWNIIPFGQIIEIQENLGGGFKYFLFSPLPGEMIQFDEHIFQMGWNHQLGIIFPCSVLRLHWCWAPPPVASWRAIHPWHLSDNGPNRRLSGDFSCRSKQTNGEIRLMAEILHQLRLVVYPIIHRVSYIPGGARFQPSTVWQIWMGKPPMFYLVFF